MVRSAARIPARLATATFAAIGLCSISSVIHAKPFDENTLAEAVCNSDEVRRYTTRPGDIVLGSDRWREVDPNRVAFIIAVVNGHMIDPGEADVFLKEIAERPSQVRGTVGSIFDVLDTYEHFQEQAVARRIAEIRIFDRAGNLVAATPAAFDERRKKGLWLFDDDITIRCKVAADALAAAAAPPEIADSTGDPKAKERERRGPIITFGKPKLRGTVDALSKSGSARKSAKAATVSLDRKRTFKDDGSRDETITWSIKAVGGIPLIEKPNIAGLTAYAGYELKKARVDPPPVLTPPATERDGDTDVLKFGVFGYALLPLGPEDDPYSTSVDITLDGSYIFDFVKDTERFRSRVTLDPYSSTDFGLCRLGGNRDWGNTDGAGSTLYSRCELQAIADFNILTDRGKLLTISKETFGHIGGKGSFALAFGKTPVVGPFFSAEYVRLWRVRGDPTVIPDISRHEFAMGYRWWTDDDIGLEVFGKLIDGENIDSFEDENQLTIGFGLIF